MTALRTLLADEAPLLAEHLARLSPEDRRLRFGGAILHPDAIRRYVDTIDWRHSFNIGAFDRAMLRGVAQIILPRPGRAADPAFPPTRDGAAEFAVSVEKPWQRRGLGTRLMAQMVVVARNRNVRDLFMLCLPENEAMRRLARKVGVKLVFANGEMSGHVDLPAPDQITVFAEFAVETAAAFDRWADLVVRMPG